MRSSSTARAVAVVLLGLTAGCAASPPPSRTPAPGTAAATPGAAVPTPRAQDGARTAVAQVGPELPGTPVQPTAREQVTASAQEIEEIERRLNALNPKAAPGKDRAAVAPEAFPIEELPRVALPEPLDGAVAPDAFEGEPATELFADWKSTGRLLGPPKGDVSAQVRVSLSGHVYGRIRIAYIDGTVNTDGSGGAVVTCGPVPPGAHRLVPARWEVLSPSIKGGLELRVVNAWFDMQRCSATIAARANVAAHCLAGGMLYAFRQSAESSNHSDKLVLIGPRFSHLATSGVGGSIEVSSDSFSRVVIPLRRGGAASVVGRIPVSSARDWAQITGVSPTPPGDLVAGVEIAQAVADPTPLAVAYVGSPRPSAPSAPVSQQMEKFQLRSKGLDPFITF